jgi:hypothetical protein
MSIDEEDDAYILFASIRYAKDLVCLECAAYLGTPSSSSGGRDWSSPEHRAHHLFLFKLGRAKLPSVCESASSYRSHKILEIQAFVKNNGNPLMQEFQYRAGHMRRREVPRHLGRQLSH